MKKRYSLLFGAILGLIFLFLAEWGRIQLVLLGEWTFADWFSILIGQIIWIGAASILFSMISFSFIIPKLEKASADKRWLRIILSMIVAISLAISSLLYASIEEFVIFFFAIAYISLTILHLSEKRKEKPKLLKLYLIILLITFIFTFILIFLLFFKGFLPESPILSIIFIICPIIIIYIINKFVIETFAHKSDIDKRDF